MKTIATLAVALIFVQSCVAQTFDENFDHWPVELKINGRILITDGLNFDEESNKILSDATDGRNVTILAEQQVPFRQVQQVLTALKDEKQEVSAAAFETLTNDTIADALEGTSNSLVLFAGRPLSTDELEALRASKALLRKILDDGGALIVDFDLAPYLGAVFQNSDKKVVEGLNLFFDTYIQTRLENTEDNRKAMLDVLAKHKRIVGLGIEENCLLLLDRRNVRCFGKGSATFALPEHNKYLKERVQTIGQRKNRRQAPQEYLIDLTEWRRDAIDRTLPQFPAESPTTPCITNGTLIMVGGGGMPSGLMRQMVELAGGLEKAKMVFVPCSQRDNVGQRQRTVESWKQMGVQHATFIHTKDRNKANTDEAFYSALKNATGVWFGGGRQWNFSDSYYGTKTHQLMKAVLDRGGVIGGSSAGASIQGRYLARATPIGNFRIMAPGYERGGLGFLSGVAIDQHFSQRGRQKDMTSLVNRYPQLLGIGLDESTALIVNKSQAEVVGRGQVFFYNRDIPVVEDKPDYVALSAGSIYDLAKRTVVKDADENKAEE